MFNIKNKASKVNKLVAAVIAFVMIIGMNSAGAYAQDRNLEEAKSIVRNYYVDKVDDSLIDGANSINDLIKGLKDPHTMYFTKDEYKDFVNSINNKFSGIGTHIDIVPMGIKVISVIDNSPAKESGIMPGDIIIEVDGKSLKGLAQDVAAGYIRGNEGTKAHLKILRGSKEIEFDIERRQISVPTVTSNVMEGHIGYIKIASFGQNTSKEFSAALKSMKGKVDNYIIDLRFNPGGYLQTALDMAGYFIGPNKALITKDRIDGDIKHYAYSHEVINKPIIFLVNEYSASASEVLSGAVRDYGKAIFIGNNTYGKGTVQTMFPLSDGSVLKMTIQRFYSPNGKPINKVGIKPDIESKGNLDSLKTALFLLQRPSNSKDKTGYQLVKIGNRGYEVNINRLKYSGYMTIYKNILKTPGVQLYNGSKKGWTRINDFSVNPHRLLYPNYRVISRIPSARSTASYTVKFSSNFLKGTVNTKSIELVSLVTGTKVPVSIKFAGPRVIGVTPRLPLKRGESYILVMNTRLKSYKNKVLGGNVIYINSIK